MQAKMRSFMSTNPPETPPIELHAVPSDPRNAGICAFAARDIARYEIVCEYTGESISLEEASRREERYAERQRPCTLMVLESNGKQVVIDPYGGDDQRPMIWGGTINHSRNNANLRPVVIDRNTSHPRVFFCSYT
ncbi:hypothetical protein OS493_012851 [Desmophyllum pertusum]|uniref:SET domain-containing protein n=1 Tax=Desmophyllum pertusum TaxID=174260 RepID=A0A9W9Z154_9CNID|nr:hypothetical protein OS493_012851 [Desmophyllum pertusum]